MQVRKDIRPRQRFHPENELEYTAQGLGSWWAGVRQNNETMDLGDLGFLVDGATVNYVTVGLKKHLQLSETAHRDSVVMAVGRAVYGVFGVASSIDVLHRSMAGFADEMMELMGR